jgi:hypothetical protein
MAAAAPASEWLQQDSRRMLHAVYRVGDMQVCAQLIIMLWSLQHNLSYYLYGNSSNDGIACTPADYERGWLHALLSHAQLIDALECCTQHLVFPWPHQTCLAAWPAVPVSAC